LGQGTRTQTRGGAVWGGKGTAARLLAFPDLHKQWVNPKAYFVHQKKKEAGPRKWKMARNDQKTIKL